MGNYHLRNWKIGRVQNKRVDMTSVQMPSFDILRISFCELSLRCYVHAYQSGDKVRRSDGNHSWILTCSIPCLISIFNHRMVCKLFWHLTYRMLHTVCISTIILTLFRRSVPRRFPSGAWFIKHYKIVNSSMAQIDLLNCKFFRVLKSWRSNLTPL